MTSRLPALFQVFGISACLLAYFVDVAGTRPTFGQETKSVAPINIGNRLELFVDRHLVESSEGIQFQLREPRDEGIAFRFDAPWEGRFCGYSTVIQQGNRFLAYYRGLPDIGKREVTCVIESKDGKNWSRPKLKYYPDETGAPTNIVLVHPSASHNFSPMLDTNQNAKPDERFKAIGGTAKSGLFAFVSEDGFKWRQLQRDPVLQLGGWVFDSQNLAFWSAHENCYVMYFRRVIKGVRAVARTTSKDFVHWTKPQRMTYSDTKSEIPRFQLYTNQTQPYFRAPHIYLATAARFFPGRRAITPEQAKRIGVDSRYTGDVSDAILLTSRGGTRYDSNFQTALLKPGIGAENWVSRTNYPALGFVPTAKHQMSWFVNQNYGQPSAHLRRYTFRLDGLASASATLEGGMLITRPITMSGSQLVLNFATSAAGSIRVEICDPVGQPMPGFELANCQPLIGNETQAKVSWKGDDSTERLIGKALILKFELKDADLFSFQFGR